MLLKCFSQMLSLWGFRSTESRQKSSSGGSLHPAVPAISGCTDVVWCNIFKNHVGKIVCSGGQRRAYLSRWKLVLREYSALHARLYNSSRLLKETKLALYTINQTTLQKWYKDRARREEITSRMLGLDLPDPPLLADSDLPLAHDQPATPPTPPGPSHHFPEPEDTTRQTCRKNVTDMGACLGPRVLCSVVATSTTSAATIDATTMESSSSTVPTEVQQEVEVETRRTEKTVSRTTLWHWELLLLLGNPFHWQSTSTRSTRCTTVIFATGHCLRR